VVFYLIDLESSKNGSDPLSPTGSGKLKENFYTKVSFHLGGVRYTLDFGEVNGDATYADLKAAIEAAIAANPDLAGKVIVEDLGTTFKWNDKVGDGKEVGYVIQLTNTGSEAFTLEADDGWDVADGKTAPIKNNIAADGELGSPIDRSELVTSTVILDYVGSGSNGGDLVIGGLSIGDTSNSGGVQEFDLNVQRDSRLEVVTSTNNSLQEVYIQNYKENGQNKTYPVLGAYERDTNTLRTGDLTVLGESGNRTPTTAIDTLSGTKTRFGYVNPNYDNSRNIAADQNIDIGDNWAQNLGFGFVDVQVIDASKGSRNGAATDFTGKLALNVVLTNRVAAKYLNPVDQAGNLAADDNAQFSYVLGTNDDVFDLSISSANLATIGGATREDFVLDIKGGAGNDVINTLIHNDGDVTAAADGIGATGTSYNNFSDWYINAKQNAALSIDAGVGADTVNAFGSGDWKVNLGAGADTF
jgi:hypothetical protein